MKTYMAKKGEINQNWYIMDAEGQILGRLATKVANILRGKDKPTYTPHVDTGDFVVVINAGKVKLTGKKEEQKVYRHHTGYPGGMREIPLKRMRERHPDRIIRHAVAGMVPKNRLGRAMLGKLKIYGGAEHPHGAQQPVEIKP